MAEPAEKIITATETQLDAIATPSLGAVSRPAYSSTRFRQDASPADTPAIRDVYSLQLAYPEVWDRMTDELLLECVVRFYELHNTVQYGPEPGVTWRPPDALTEDQIKKDLGILRDRPLEPSPVPDNVLYWFDIDPEVWHALGPERQTVILGRVQEMDALRTSGYAPPGGTNDFGWLTRFEQLRMQEAEVQLSSIPPFFGSDGSLQISKWYEDIRSVVKILSESPKRRMQQDVSEDTSTYSWERVVAAIKELQDELTNNYTFDVFTPNSYNYGLLGTYRQTWKPGPYQTGDLVATIPLAPGESRKFSTNRVVNKSREQKTAEERSELRRTESSKMSRAEAEITRRAHFKISTSFKNETEYDAKMVDSSNTSEVSGETSQDSSRVKKSLSEATLKAAAEFKTQTRIEVTTSSSEKLEESSSGEIRNPNNEITVTYLFYELQRQYIVTQVVHSVEPVILVAQEVPSPSEVDEDFLIKHAWIIGPVLLDDRFQAALDYLQGEFVADEQRVMLKRQELAIETRLMQELESQMATLLDKRAIARNALRDAIRKQHESQGILEDIGEAIFGGGQDDADIAQSRLEAAQRTLETLESDVVEARNELEHARESLRRTTDELSEALRAQITHRMAISECRIHVKQNIIHYMQAIWRSEVIDQRYYRLYDLEVQVPMPPDETAQFSIVADDSLRDLNKSGDKKPIKEQRWTLKWPTANDKPPAVKFEPKKLREIADIGNLLGFHGNYAIFPLRQSNFMTTFMALSYLGDGLELWDPDEESNYNIDEILARVRKLKEVNPDFSRSDWKKIREKLQEWLNKPPTDNRIVVPWHHLFIECLPGKHPLLEDFKLEHRRIDVEKAKAEVRAIELENIRRASRILGGENEDPDVDKKVIIEGTSIVPVVSTDGGT